MQGAPRGNRAQQGAIPGEASDAFTAPSGHGTARPLPTLLGIGPHAVRGVQPPAMPFAVGEVLTEGKSYHVLSLIGAGEISLVVEALERERAQVIALKCLRPEFAAQHAAADHFLARAHHNLTLESEHIARVHEVGRLADGTPFLVMDRLRGSDLRMLLEEAGALLVKRAAALALQICEALATGHAAGVVHRGLRPENIIITREDAGERLELLEFGTSSQGLLNASPRAELAQRPPSYRPPEQRHRTGPLDVRSDIWSLGCILFEMFSGRAARFGVRRGPDGRPREAPIVALRTLRPELPVELATLVARCLAQDPEQRFQNVAELAHELAPYAPPSAAALAERCTELVGCEPERVSGVRRMSRRGPVPVARKRREDPSGGAWRGPLALVLCVPIVSGLGWLFASQPPARPELPARSEAPSAPATPAVDPPATTAPSVAPTPDGTGEAGAERVTLGPSAPAHGERDRSTRAPRARKAPRSPAPHVNSLAFKPDPYGAPEATAESAPVPIAAP
jgi:eukaryotic-like serine/threonine-protein kinase